jgi:photosystem II stability/assembly factor-like uncharacterized protein
VQNLYKNMNTKRIIIVLASVVFFAGCSLTGGGNDGGVFRSDDGGKTFSQKAAAEQNKTISGIDVLSMAIDPQNGSTIYLGTKATGIFKSDNGGDLWKQLKVSTATPTKVYALAIDPTNTQIIYAAAIIGGRGKIVKSEDGGGNWKEIYTEPNQNGLVLSLAVPAQNPQNIFAGNDKGEIIFSKDGGQSWRSLYWTQGNKAVYKIAIDSANPNVAYFLLFQSGVLKTTDGGNTFQELKTGGDNTTFSLSKSLDKAVTLAADPSRGNWLYVGDVDGLLRTKDQGNSWETVKTLNNPSDVSIRSIDINPQNSDEIIFAAAQAFYKTNDGGVSWMPIEFNTQRSPEVVKYNSQNPSQIFVGMNSR